MKKLKDQGFHNSGSIHSHLNIKFYEQILKADDLVLGLLRNGLKPPFKNKHQQINTYFEANNKSCIGHEKFLWETVVAWQELGTVKEVFHPPLVIYPLSVVEKYDSATDTIKLRPVIDMSRYINPLLQDFHVKLDDLTFSEPFLELNMWMCSFDITSMFHHLKLSEDETEYFGFCLTDRDGRRRYFVFNVLMFGVKVAVYIMDRLLKPVKEFLHTLGIFIGIYIDDGRILHKDKTAAWFSFLFVLNILQISPALFNQN